MIIEKPFGHDLAHLDAGCTAPLIGDFHYNGHLLLTRYPDCARALDKYRINPGNVGTGKRRDEQFSTICKVAVDHNKPVRIGVNTGEVVAEDATELFRLADMALYGERANDDRFEIGDLVHVRLDRRHIDAARRLLSEYAPTHLISVERPGRTRGGDPFSSEAEPLARRRSSSTSSASSAAVSALRARRSCMGPGLRFTSAR